MLFTITVLKTTDATQFANVFWKLSKYFALTTLLQLLSSLKPFMNLFEHLMDNVTVFINKHTVKSSQVVFASFLIKYPHFTE